MSKCLGAAEKQAAAQTLDTAVLCCVMCLQVLHQVLCLRQRMGWLQSCHCQRGAQSCKSGIGTQMLSSLDQAAPVCTYLRPRNIWYRKNWWCSGVRSSLALMTCMPGS